MVAGCEEADISWAQVGRPEDLISNEQLQAPGGLLNLAMDTAKNAVTSHAMLPSLPLEFGEHQTRPALQRQPPSLGQHSEEILLELGLDKANVAALYRDGVIT